MDPSFYTAAVGAAQQQLRLNVHANNISNVNTYGFRAEKPSFSALMTGPIDGINEDLPRGVGSRMEMTQTDYQQNGLAETGLPFDYAIEGDGFFALFDPVSGTYSYSRDGSFQMSERIEMIQNSDGGMEQGSRWYLADALGRFVLGQEGRPIEVTDREEMLPVGVFDFINKDGMHHEGENTVIPVDKNGNLRRGDGKLVQGYLERSNTDLANEIAKVIESQRSFSYMLKMVQTSDDIMTTVNGLR